MEPIAPKPKCNATTTGIHRATIERRAGASGHARHRGLAGRIEGQQEAIGVQFAFEDLLIGATELHLRYEVATLNLRDFRRIPICL